MCIVIKRTPYKTIIVYRGTLKDCKAKKGKHNEIIFIKGNKA